MRLFVVVMAVLVSAGCSHVVRIESTPGAEILVDGVSVGTAPVTHTEQAGNGPAKITARLNGVEKHVMVERSEIQWGAVGAGAGAGTGAMVGGCCLMSAGNLLTGGVFWPVFALGQCLFCAAPFAGGGGAFAMMGHHLPDNVRVDLDGAGPPAASATPAAPASIAPAPAPIAPAPIAPAPIAPAPIAPPAPMTTPATTTPKPPAATPAPAPPAPPGAPPPAPKKGKDPSDVVF